MGRLQAASGTQICLQQVVYQLPPQRSLVRGEAARSKIRAAGSNQPCSDTARADVPDGSPEAEPRRRLSRALLEEAFEPAQEAKLGTAEEMSGARTVYAAGRTHAESVGRRAVRTQALR